MSGLFFGGLFWGILISLIGLSIVLKYAFHIDLPLVRLFFGIIIILIGLRIIAGQTAKHQVKAHIITGRASFAKDYDVVFASSTIDLTNLDETGKLPKEISVVFGSAVVVIPDSLNLDITSTTVFGSTILPGRSYAGFGEDRYTIRNNPNGPVYQLETTVVFGKLVFEIIPGNPAQTSAPADSAGTDSGAGY